MKEAHPRPDSGTRHHILQAALHCFAEQGYAATSVREIVGAAKVSKPVLYYYFKDKADLFAALVEHAHSERYRLIRAAAERGRTTAEKLEGMVASLFEYSLENRELTRLAFTSVLASSARVEPLPGYQALGRRVFEYVVQVLAAGQASGELTRDLPPEDMAMAIYGLLNSYVLVRLFLPEAPVDQATAHKIVRLFLDGARAGRVKSAGRARGQAKVGRQAGRKKKVDK